MELSLRGIATHPKARTTGVEPSANSVLQWLSGMERDWLILFDNASNDHGVSKHIPKGNRGNILFTSRNPMLAHFVRAENRMEVDDMEEEDAISLLLRSSHIEEGSTQASQAGRLIVKEFACLPLAVDQAGAAITSGLCNLDDYLHRYVPSTSPGTVGRCYIQRSFESLRTTVVH